MRQSLVERQGERTTPKWRIKAIYIRQIKQSIARFEKEQGQIQTNLNLLDTQIAELQAELANIQTLFSDTESRITTLQQTIVALKLPKHHLSQYNRAIYRYSTNERVFHSKVNRLILLVLKSNPEKAYRIDELLLEMLKLDGQANVIPTDQHYASVHNALAKLAKKGFIQKSKLLPREMA